MSNTTIVDNNLGNIITNASARKLIYGIYAVAAIVVGGIGAYFLGTGHVIPEAVVGAQAVIAYLGIPVSGLALANASKPAVVAAVADVPRDAS